MKLQHRGNCIIVTYIPNRGMMDGWYDGDLDKIFIHDTLSPLMRECVYYHELTHRECHKSNCKCSEDYRLSEYHAFKGEMMKVIMRDSPRLTRAYLKETSRSLLKYERNPIWKDHLVSLRRLMKTKTFKKIKRMQ